VFVTHDIVVTHRDGFQYGTMDSTTSRGNVNARSPPEWLTKGRIALLLAYALVLEYRFGRIIDDLGGDQSGSRQKLYE
jgi:hypothetical protein